MVFAYIDLLVAFDIMSLYFFIDFKKIVLLLNYYLVLNKIHILHPKYMIEKKRHRCTTGLIKFLAYIRFLVKSLTSIKNL